MAPAQQRRRVIVGVDTHADVHVARAKDHLGERLGELEFPTTPAGYALVAAWAGRFGKIEAFGVEGTGSYGAALARYLSTKGYRVLEVSRPQRQVRRRHGKSDPVDADAAASAVLSGDALGVPKAQDGPVEAVRVLRVARRSAVKARVQAINSMKALVITAPVGLREELRGLSISRLVKTCASLRPVKPTEPASATRSALRSLARRHQALADEVAALDIELDRLVGGFVPELVASKGIKTDAAGALLVAVGDNPDRLCSERALAALFGASPVEASSGKTVRHRLNRGGNREANAALHRIVVNRLSWDPRTKQYLARRTAEGKSTSEIIRCLKRYVVREVHRGMKSCIALNPPGVAA